MGKMQKECMVKHLSLLSVSATQEGRGHINASVKWGKAENAQFFHDIENFLSQQNINIIIQKYNSLASLLNLLTPPPIFCFSYHHSDYGCVITQCRAPRAGHRIQGLFLFVAILIISLAALKCFFYASSSFHY